MNLFVSRLSVALLPLLAAPAEHSRSIAESRVPFEVGERATYNAKVGALNAGKAVMAVESIERVRGMAAYHTSFDLHGRVLFKRFDNHYESWIDTTALTALRLMQKTGDGEKHYEFYPDRRVYIKNDSTENPSVSEPLDVCSFLFYLRTLPLDAGHTYSVNRYYHADRNPITITVVRREHISVPAGEFDAIVVHPVIQSNGLFSPKSSAEVWLSADPSHLILRLKSGLPLGTLTLELKQVERPN
jgi:hypothetical protein